MSDSALVRAWPAAGLRARSGDLELRWADDALAVQLAELAARGVHPPDTMPFLVPWTRAEPEKLVRETLAYYWGVRGQIGPELFRLELAVLLDGVVVGVQGAGGRDWSVLRTLETGSWLGLAYQGRGIGSRMRALMLELLFDGLGARVVTSGAYVDNPASNAVSRRVGYVADGQDEVVRDGVPTPHQRYRLTREDWRAVREANLALLGAPVELEGAEAVRRQSGIDDGGPSAT